MADKPGLLGMFSQYLRDAAPGGALNPEVSGQGMLDTAALSLSPVPIVGDVVGLAADANRYYHNPEERTAGNFALTGLGMLPFVPAMAGIFAGKGAKTADVLKLDRAQKLEKAGADPDAIWKETGWWRGADKEWRFEIPDNAARMKREWDLPPTKELTWGDAIDHPGLFSAYPDLQHMPFETRNFRPNVSGGLSPADLRISLNASLDDRAARSAMLHEMNHGVQQVERFAPGGSADMAFRDTRMYSGTNPKAHAVARGMLADKMKDMTTPLPIEEYARVGWQSHEITPEIERAYNDYARLVREEALDPALVKEAQKNVAFEWYKRLAGEAESRAVEARADYNPAWLASKPPHSSFDVPFEQQIDLRPPAPKAKRKTK